MMCYENSEEQKNENRDDENKQESKNPEDDEREGDPGNTEEPQGTPLMQLYISNVFTTGITNEWAMSTTEDNSATPRVPSTV